MKSGTRLVVPFQDVAPPYWKGIHRMFGDVASPEGSHLQFAQGEVAEVLARISSNAELLVLGARQPMRSRAYLDGAISRACIAAASCPVTTVPTMDLPAPVVAPTARQPAYRSPIRS